MPISPAQALLLETCQPAPDARLLLLEGGDGALAAHLAMRVPTGEVLSLARDFNLLRAAQAMLEAIPNAIAGDSVLPTSSGWDLVLLTIPKERRYARSLLLAAWGALKPGGRLLLSGPTRQGAKAVITDAGRLFGNATVLGYRSHQRVAACQRGETTPDPLPEAFQQVGVAPGSSYRFEVQRPSGRLTLETHPGIFSWEGLDEGTALLLAHLVIEPGMRVWDVGCGYGVIGLSAVMAGAKQAWLSDVNLLAVDYAQKNTVHNQLQDHTLVFPADGLALPSNDFESPPRFDLLVSNPAFHRGHQVDRSMAEQLIAQAPAYLAPHGRLVLVANRFLNYERAMSAHFKRVTRLAETPQYHLLQAEV